MTAPRSAPSGRPAQAGASPDSDTARQPGSYADPGGQGGTAGERYATARLASLSRHAWPAVLTAAVGVAAVGVLLLVWPRETLTVVAILLGAGLLVAGLFRLFEGFTAREESGATRAAYVVIGLIAAVVGLFCLRHHDLSLFLVAFIVGAFWIIHGVADVAVAAMAGPVPGRGLKAIAGVLSVAAGCVVLFWPGISLVLLFTILGAWLIVYGVVLAAVAFQLRRAGRRPVPF
jgi:uncharacterized membrane protein HdeD (DUF308 family)